MGAVTAASNMPTAQLSVCHGVSSQVSLRMPVEEDF